MGVIHHGMEYGTGCTRYPILKQTQWVLVCYFFLFWIFLPSLDTLVTSMRQAPVMALLISTEVRCWCDAVIPCFKTRVRSVPWVMLISDSSLRPSSCCCSRTAESAAPCLETSRKFSLSNNGQTLHSVALLTGIHELAGHSGIQCQ